MAWLFLDQTCNVIRKIMNQAVEDTSVNENINDDILKTTSVPSTEAVLEKMDMAAQDITKTENLFATPGPSAKGIGEIVEEIAEDKIENREATFTPNTERIPETVRQEAVGIDVIGKLTVTPGPSVKEIGERINETVEDFKVTEDLKDVPVFGTEMFAEILDLDKVSDTESFVTAPESIITEISERMDEVVKDLKVTGVLRAAPICGTEIFTKFTDLDEDYDTESFVTALESSTEGDEIMYEATEDISGMENVEFLPSLNAERIPKIKDKDVSFAENLEVIPVSSSTDVSETHVQNENTTNIVFDKRMRNTKNEVENETSKTMVTETKSLKTVSESKIKSLKRKSIHPSISEMLMDSIKSLKKRNGVSFEDIKTQMEENYPVNVKGLVKYHVDNYLKKWVEMGILEKVDGADVEERFIIKESEIGNENNCRIQAKKLKIN